MRYFVLLFFLITITPATGQSGSRFGGELLSQYFIVDLPEGNTEADTRFSYGLNLVGVVEFNVSAHVRVESGLQLGYSVFRQRVIQRDAFSTPPGNILRSLAVEASYLSLGLPLFVKYAPLGNMGPYLKVGFRGQLNSGPTTWARVMDDNGNVPDDAAIFPAGEVEVSRSSFAPEVGIGYRFYGPSGRVTYLELSYAKVIGDVLRHQGPRDAAGRSNLLDTTRAEVLALTIGYRFGG